MAEIPKEYSSPTRLLTKRCEIASRRCRITSEDGPPRRPLTCIVHAYCDGKIDTSSNERNPEKARATQTCRPLHSARCGKRILGAGSCSPISHDLRLGNDPSPTSARRQWYEVGFTTGQIARSLLIGWPVDTQVRYDFASSLCHAAIRCAHIRSWSFLAHEYQLMSRKTGTKRITTTCISAPDAAPMCSVQNAKHRDPTVVFIMGAGDAEQCKMRYWELQPTHMSASSPAASFKLAPGLATGVCPHGSNP